MTTSPPFSALAFFASSSIAFLAARRSFRSAFRLALPVRAAPLTRFFAASCVALAPRFTFSARAFFESRALSVFFFLFCHPGATMPRRVDARASAGQRRRAVWG